MIEHLVALAVAERLNVVAEFNSNLPEYGFVFDPDIHDLAEREASTLLNFTENNLVSLDRVITDFRNRSATTVTFDGFFQRLDLLPDYRTCQQYFPLRTDDNIAFADDELVINVRAGEIVGGVSIYPLVPPNFYRELIENTGYRPVFLGQLDESAYVKEIKRLFPSARLIPSAGPLIDFERLRRAKRLCLAVSTFSWLAAWMSNAKEIHFPLLGFLHPRTVPKDEAGQGGIDLVPTDDPRYRFHLFPVIVGTPEADYLAFTSILSPVSKEISRSQARYLRYGVTLLPHAPCRTEFDINEWWYLRTYIDAAWEISEGWYKHPAHHYAEVGSRRGYQARMPRYIPRSECISVGKVADQSSISKWSYGKSTSADAARALCSNYSEDFAFHTDIQDHPWWCVDLTRIYEIESIHIYNRRNIQFVRKRVFPLVIETSLDGKEFKHLETIVSNFALVCAEGPNLPYQYVPKGIVLGRFIRLSVSSPGAIFHLAAVDVYGKESKP